jgi:hypothetical protein
MAFIFTWSITPKVEPKKMTEEWINRSWLEFQEKAFNLGDEMLAYMRNFISERSHREGKTGNLINAIRRYGNVEPGAVWWGIGHITELNAVAKYWAILNFGGMTWAGLTGTAVPGHFGEDKAPDHNQAGTGVGQDRFTHSPYIKNEHGKQGNYFMHVHSQIHPINYIEASQQQLNNEILNILNRMKNEEDLREARG